MIQKIPLDVSPNQSFKITLTVDDRNIDLNFKLRYNRMAGYWVMSIINPVNGNLLLDSIPLLTGKYPAGNILEPHSYLEIGSAYILNVGASLEDYPDNIELGGKFILVWGDTEYKQ